MTKLPEHFISCDWGTTNFRLRLVETDTLKVLLEHPTDQGIRKLYEKYLQQRKYTQKQFFSNYLQEQLENIPDVQQNIPIILAGMASSTIGLQELEYANFPFEEDGNSLISEQLSLHNGLEIILISGVKSETGMIRGEETQAIGLGEYLAPFEEGMLLLPGTHSKHMRYEKGSFTKLTNFMTGELFEVLSKKSILASSVTAGEWTEATKEAFQEGLTLGFKNKLSSSLLLVRANHVIKHTQKEYNFYLLSGLLIGDELSYLKNKKDKIFLAAPDPIFSLYKTGLELLFDAEQLVFFEDSIIEHALLLAQKKILALHVK